MSAQTAAARLFTAQDERALRVLKRMRRDFARKEDREASEGSGLLAAFYYTTLQEIDRRIAGIEGRVGRVASPAEIEAARMVRS